MDTHLYYFDHEEFKPGFWSVLVVVVAVLIFLVTLALVIVQPRRIGIGWWASAGAIVALGAGVVTIANVGTVWGIVWNATFTFVGIILISIILDSAGFFRYAALVFARAANGSGTKLFVFLIAVGALVSALFANDGGALILTPIVIEILLSLGFESRAELAFILAIGFIADAASLPLTISNLVNIVSADYFRLQFTRYAEIMIPVDLVAIVASTFALWVVFRRAIPLRLDTGRLEQPQLAIRDLATFRAGLMVLPALLAGYVLSDHFNVPVSLVTGFAALLLAGVAGRRQLLRVSFPASRGDGEQAIDLPKLVRGAPWQVVVFSLGMYVVVYGLRNEGLTSLLASGLRSVAHYGGFAEILAAGFGSALLSSVMNNMPTVLIGALSITQSHLANSHFLAYANVVGCDLGPKLTPIGSLATLLWLHVLDSRGLKVSWKEYVRYGFMLTIPVLAVVLSGLFLITTGLHA